MKEILRLLRRPYVLPLIGFLAAIAFGTLVYPILEPDFHATISTDGHDRLGLGIYHYDSLTFYPSHEPTVMRGPVYPVVVAAALSVGGEENLRWTILILQAIMHAVTVWLGSQIAAALFVAGDSRRETASIIAGLIIALHPFLLWYLTRVVVEPVSILLCTMAVMLLLKFSRSGQLLQGLLYGGVAGLAILTKSTYLLLLPLVPILLLLARRHAHFASPGRIVLCTFVIPLCILLPWTLRNYSLTGSVVPVHILDGVNFAVGDFFVEELPTSPLGYAPIAERFRYPGLPEGLAGMMVMSPEESVAYDRAFRERSLARYSDDPLFLVRKIAIQSITFWTMGSRPMVTIVIGGMQLLLLLTVILAAWNLIRRGGLFSPELLPLWLLLAYWLAHTPLYAIGRFSVVWVPTMVGYGVWWVSNFKCRTSIEDRDAIEIRKKGHA